MVGSRPVAFCPSEKAENMNDLAEMPSIVLVGAGYWGKNLARNFARIGELAGIVDGNAEQAAAIAEANNCRVMSLPEAISDPAVKAIAIATPAPSHAAIAELALNGGKAVFIEKPICLSEAEGEKIVQLSKDAGKPLMIGHLLRYHPMFRTLLSCTAAGAVGKPRHLLSRRNSLGKVRVEEDVLWSFAPHDISMALAVAGEMPSSVEAQGVSLLTPGIADCVTLQLKFPSGMHASLEVSWVSVRKEQRLVVTGDKGSLVFDDTEPDWPKKLQLHPVAWESGGREPQAGRGTVEYFEITEEEPLLEECRHFVHCVRTGAKPLTDGNEGLAVLNVLVKAEESLRRNMGC
jgi:predicted dehydrogenase